MQKSGERYGPLMTFTSKETPKIKGFLHKGACEVPRNTPTTCRIFLPHRFQPLPVSLLHCTVFSNSLFFLLNSEITDKFRKVKTSDTHSHHKIRRGAYISPMFTSIISLHKQKEAVVNTLLRLVLVP